MKRYIDRVITSGDRKGEGKGRSEEKSEKGWDEKRKSMMRVDDKERKREMTII